MRTRRLVASTVAALALVLPASAAASFQQVLVSFTATLPASGGGLAQLTAVGGPFGDTPTPGTDTVDQSRLRGSLVRLTNPHEPNLQLSVTDTSTFGDGTITANFNETCRFVLPVGAGTTFTCAGGDNFIGGTGVFAGAN